MLASGKTKNQKINEAIIRTIAFFDMFDYPLTAFEIWQYCDTASAFEEITAVLKKEDLKGILEEQGGFYFFSGRKRSVETRARRYNYAKEKLKRAILVARIFKFIPWINLIALSNVIGADNLKDESDIDLFIVTEPKRIWITRFFCAGFLKLLDLRPKENKTKNKICLNFYVAAGSLDLKSLTLNGGKDIYFVHWLAGLIPVFDKHGTYGALIEKNGWVLEYLPNWSYPKRPLSRQTAGEGPSGFYRDVVDMFVGGLEKDLKAWQLRKLPTALKKGMNKDTRVTINDQVLKLHSKDRREEYRRRWQERLEIVLG
ncbi:MAG: hypothetical protein V1867_01050 [Candidatus Falkowbacteria bacterium]